MGPHDFWLGIEAPDGTGQPQVRVESPAGHGRSPLPIDVQAIEDLLPALSLWISRSSNSVRDLASRAVPLPQANPREIGARLYQALFQGDDERSVERLLNRTLGRLSSPPFLRVQIQLSFEQRTAARIARLPWELLFDGHEFLHRGDTRRPLTRYLEVPEPITPIKVQPPLRVLVVIPTAPPIDAHGEKTRIEQAWRKRQGLVRFCVLDNPTLETIRDELRRTESHVLHFIGHGAFERGAGEGALLLHDGGCSGEIFAANLRAASPWLRLVVINACESAQLDHTRPFAGVASALVRSGIPAVVAMQFPITDAAALAFSEGFYARLAAGDAVDVAVDAGRLAIRSALPGTFEWATPVLYLRARDGVLFEIRGWAENLSCWRVGRLAAGHGLLTLLGLVSHAYSLGWLGLLLASLFRGGSLSSVATAALPVVLTVPLGLRCERAITLSRGALWLLAALLAALVISGLLSPTTVP